MRIVRSPVAWIAAAAVTIFAIDAFSGARFSAPPPARCDALQLMGRDAAGVDALYGTRMVGMPPDRPDQLPGEVRVYRIDRDRLLVRLHRGRVAAVAWEHANPPTLDADPAAYVGLERHRLQTTSDDADRREQRGMIDGATWILFGQKGAAVIG